MRKDLVPLTLRNPKLLFNVSHGIKINLPFHVEKGRKLFTGFKYFLHLRFEFSTRYEYTVTTAFAFDPNICPHSDNLPAILPTRVRFFHLDNIIQFIRLSSHQEPSFFNFLSQQMNHSPLHHVNTSPYVGMEFQCLLHPVCFSLLYESRGQSPSVPWDSLHR